MNFKIAKLKEKLLEKWNETLKAVLPIIAIGADLMLLDRTSGAGYPAGFPSGSRVSYRGDDVLYPRRGDGYDAYR